MNPFHSLLRIAEGISSRRRNLWFRALGVRIEGYVWLRRISIPRQWRNIQLELGVALDDGVVLLATGEARHETKILIRSGTYINRYTIIDAAEDIELGRDCMVGPHCYITDHDHAHLPGKRIHEQPLVTRSVRLGNDVWLGAGAKVLKGVTIGDGAVIGAGAVVRESVPKSAIAVGIPARVVATRT
jgi:acetyltransferase-like isoleucine patch superfamily enzyme